MQRILAIVLLLALSSLALAHNHLTVDTLSGQPGDPIIIKAGYLSGENVYTISNNRLFYNGHIAVYDLPFQLTQTGDLHNWFGNSALVLTSDFFFATGRLTGGDFMWELASVTPIAGSACIASWGDFNTSGILIPSALSNAAARIDRSFDTGIAGHDHNQACAFSTPGLYDLTFIAWDRNNRYADSAPVKVRFRVGPASIPGDTNFDSHVNIDDLTNVILEWGPCDACPADLNADGVVNIDDLTTVILNWNS
ncbi:MAG TPA: hypothetical protein VG711_06110 [Phycisphaerales bacterium]|nr:hypothetical protein [Phycisphaerales bacterium]